MSPRPALVISSLIILVLYLSVPLFRDTLFVVGGKYTLHPGEVVDGDLKVLFAQVELEQGSQVKGELTGISSDLDINGTVTGDFLSLESDVIVSTSCKIGGAQREFDLFNYIILIPEITRLRLSLSQ